MIYLTIYLTSHLMTTRTRNQTKFRYIFVPYGYVLVPSRVTLRLRNLLIFRNLLILIHTSVYFIFYILFFCFFFCFTNSFVFSPRFFLMFKIFLYLLIPPHCIIMTQYVFQSFLGLVYYVKSRRSLWMIIFVRVILIASL